MNGRSIAPTLLTLLLTATLAGCSFEVRRQRYEVTMELEVDSEIKSATSVLEYRHRFEIQGGHGMTMGGVSPIMNLGRHGDLALALDAMGKVETSNTKIDGRSCMGGSAVGLPTYAYGLVEPDKYPRRGFDPSPLVTIWFKEWMGRVDVPIERWPAFLWRPHGVTSQVGFRFLTACAFEGVFDGAVRVRRITFATTAKPLVTRLPNPPKWIEDWVRELETTPPSRGGNRGRRVTLRAVEWPTLDEIAKSNAARGPGLKVRGE